MTAYENAGIGTKNAHRSSYFSRRPLVLSHELRLSEDMALHGFFQIGFALAGGGRQFHVEGVEPEVIAMRSRGRARSGVAVGPAVVLALQAAGGQVVLVGRFFCNVVDRSGNV